MKFDTFRILIVSYLTASVALLLFTYTQVDLGLTLTKVSLTQVIQKSFQYIGFYQRPISTIWFILILLSFFCLYGWAMYLAWNQKLKRIDAWRIILSITLLLIFSYPAFSHDIFNHMFTAKSILLYKKNPYLVTPLDFTGIDPWLGFMHWTHVVSIYQPLWIGVTIAPYLLGFGKFLLTLYNTKLVIAGFYIITSFFIEKSLMLIDKKYATVGLVIFALSPLSIIEVLVSAHNDIAMIAFAMIAYYFYLKKERIISFLMISISIAMKPITFIFLSLYILRWKKVFMLLCSILSFLAVVFFAKFTGRDLQPWYLLIVLSVVALIPKSRQLFLFITFASFGLLLQYAPYFYFGNWNHPVGQIRFWVVIVPIIASICFVVINRYFLQNLHKK